MAPRPYYGVSPVVYGGYGRYWDARARQWRHHQRDSWQDRGQDQRRHPH